MLVLVRFHVLFHGRLQLLLVYSDKLTTVEVLTIVQW